MNRTGANAPKAARLEAWLSERDGKAADAEKKRIIRFPLMPQIPEAYLNRRGVVYLKQDDGDLHRQYEGPIEVGMIFAWEPDVPTARQLAVVCEITTPADDEIRIWTMGLDSPMREQPERWKAAMRHVSSHLFEGAPTWNDESRFREAVVPTMFNPQMP